MPSTQKSICVYENWSSEIPRKLGVLYVEYNKGTEHYSFEYSEEWLKQSFAYVLDPDLVLYRGRQYPIDKKSFGLFADSSPDRWGRVLMQRRERITADKEGRKPNKLTESDYLLGVYDEILTLIKENWENLAKKYKLSRGAIDYMRPAFSACYK